MAGRDRASGAGDDLRAADRVETAGRAAGVGCEPGTGALGGALQEVSAEWCTYACTGLIRGRL